MKRNRLLLLLALLPAWMMQAQTSYEAAVLLDTELSGTARYVGMGGAMGALGADMSTMSTNPAGTALYRSHQTMAADPGYPTYPGLFHPLPGSYSGTGQGSVPVLQGYRAGPECGFPPPANAPPSEAGR